MSRRIGFIGYGAARRAMTAGLRAAGAAARLKLKDRFGLSGAP